MGLKQLGSLYFPYVERIEELKVPHEFDQFISSLYAKDWVVYCKPPFKLCPVCGIGHLIRPSPA